MNEDEVLELPSIPSSPAQSPPPVKTKNAVDPSELSMMIQSKINQLESDATMEEEEEREIQKAVKIEHRKLSTLVNETDTEIGKVTLLQRKYTSLFQDMQRLEREHARSKAKSEKFQREKDHTKIELNKAMNMKHKLETLCRELQKENKRIKEESKRLAQTEQQKVGKLCGSNYTDSKRVELNNKFESTIWEIKTKMEEDNGEKNKRRIEDNELKDKFKSFLEQYELREAHYHNVLRAKDLEVQLHQARSEQHRKTVELESARAKTLHSQVSTFSQTETELRSQLNIYVEKFKQVEDTLNNSNDLFLNFRKEMEQMTKKTKKLEKENAAIRTKCDTANRNILEMAEERAKYRKEIDATKKKATKLENLCRALQAERVSLESKLSTYEVGPETDDELDNEEGDEEGSFTDEYDASEDDQEVEEESLDNRPGYVCPDPE